MNKLGFGFLRIPTTGEDGKDIDLELLNAMVDVFLSRGKTYFDTAYNYLDGKSEWAIRESVVKRYPRDHFMIADKLPGYLVTSPEDCSRYFEEQLERCGVDFFDVYLLHGLNAKYYEIAERYQQFAFLQELKAAGKVKKIGFSYHDLPELLDEILTRHPEMDYVQLQINYVDWDSESIQAKRCYEVAVKHGKKVIVMEPVKGGTLVNLPEDARSLLQKLSPEASPASFAIRFATSLPEVEIVLSGMNRMEQLLDNLQETAPLSAEELLALQKVADIICRSTAVPCTACGYCVKDCPQHICIPQYFVLYNDYSRTPKDKWKITPAYRQLTLQHGRAAECIGCRKCEQRCPQKLPVTTYLAQVSSVFDAKRKKEPSV